MLIKLSYNEAMTIQRAQMIWYRQMIGRNGIKAIRAKTKPCPLDKHPDEPLSIFEINRLVPRGADFERYIKNRPKEIDQTRISWHNAIRRGIY